MRIRLAADDNGDDGWYPVGTTPVGCQVGTLRGRVHKDSIHFSCGFWPIGGSGDHFLYGLEIAVKQGRGKFIRYPLSVDSLAKDKPKCQAARVDTVIPYDGSRKVVVRTFDEAGNVAATSWFYAVKAGKVLRV